MEPRIILNVIKSDKINLVICEIAVFIFFVIIVQTILFWGLFGSGSKTSEGIIKTTTKNSFMMHLYLFCCCAMEVMIAGEY